MSVQQLKHMYMYIHVHVVLSIMHGIQVCEYMYIQYIHVSAL